MPAVSRRELPTVVKSPNNTVHAASASNLMPSPSPLDAASHRTATIQTLLQKKTPPSRERVSAAIALVRARQAAVKRSSMKKAASPTGSIVSGVSIPVAPQTTASSFTASAGVPIGAISRGKSPSRSPLTPKPLVQSSQQAGSPRIIMESSTKTAQAGNNTSPLTQTTDNNSTNLQSSNRLFIASNFASRAAAITLNLPPLTLSPRSGDEPLVDQENTPRSKTSGSPNGFIGHGDVSRGRSRFAAAQMGNPRTPTRKIASGDMPMDNVPVRNSVLHSVDSDECCVDPETLADVSRFIDALHKQNGGVVEGDESSLDQENSKASIQFIERLPKQDSDTSPKSERPEFQRATSGSSDDSLPLNPETIEVIGNFIDAISMPKVDTLAPISPEKMDEIGKFIDAIAKPKAESAVSVPTPTAISQVPSDSSTDSFLVNSETIEEIGHIIDAIAKPKSKSCVTTSKPAQLPSDSSGDSSFVDYKLATTQHLVPQLPEADSDSDEDSIPMSTRAGIGAFIDALQKKSNTPISTAHSPGSNFLALQTECLRSPQSSNVMSLQESTLNVSSSDDDSLMYLDDYESVIPETDDELNTFIATAQKALGECGSDVDEVMRLRYAPEKLSSVDEDKTHQCVETLVVETVTSSLAEEQNPMVSSEKANMSASDLLHHDSFIQASSDSDEAETLFFDSIHEIKISSLQQSHERPQSRLAGEHIEHFLVGDHSIESNDETPWETEPDIDKTVEIEQPEVDELEQLRALQSFENNTKRNDGLLEHKSLLNDDDIGVVTIAKIKKELAEGNKPRHPTLKDIEIPDNSLDEDEGDLVAAFLQGSLSLNKHSLPASPDQITLKSYSTMESIDQDENIKKFLSKLDQSGCPDYEEDSDRINYYIKKAMERSRSGTLEEQRASFVSSMMQSGLPENVVHEIVEGFFPKDLDMSKEHNVHGAKQAIIDDFFSKLTPPEGASTEEITKLNEFIKHASPLLQLTQLSLVQEAELRIAATRVGISAKVIDGLLDETEYLQRVASTLSGCSSVDSEDVAVKVLNDMKFEQIEDIDENDNITAFLSRMEALKEGGHFHENGEVPKGTEKVAEEVGVEIDAQHGFVNICLEREPEEGDWWTEEEGKKTLKSRNIKTTVDQAVVVAVESGNEDGRYLKTIDSTFSLELDNSLSLSLSVKESEFSLHKKNPKEKSMEEITAAIEMARSARKKMVTDISAGSIVSIKGNKRRDAMKESENGKCDTNENQALVAYNGFQLASPSDLMLNMFSGFLSPGDRATLLSRRHASKWRNPWEKRWCLEYHEKDSRPINLLMDLDERCRISGVAAASTIFKRREVRERAIPIRQQWQSTYKDRTQNHQGYFNVHVFSLYNAAMVNSEWHDLDDEPWEDREVLQNFLHEKSISFSRNWFGDLNRTRGNDRVKLPVARPKSMEMPTENLPDAGEWVEEWYTTWQTRNTSKNHESPSSSFSDSSFDSGSESYSQCTRNTRGDDTVTRSDDDEGNSYSQSMYTENDDESTWEEPPECGTLLNVKLKIGERLTRVHPDHTSSLRRSRWRKKYFPPGTFPF